MSLRIIIITIVILLFKLNIIHVCILRRKTEKKRECVCERNGERERERKNGLFSTAYIITNTLVKKNFNWAPNWLIIFNSLTWPWIEYLYMYVCMYVYMYMRLYTYMHILLYVKETCYTNLCIKCEK